MVAVRLWPWSRPSVGPERKPWLLEYRSNSGFIQGVVAVAIFTDIFLYGLIVPVFPFSLETRVSIAHSSVQRWIAVLLAIYGAGLLITSPVAGYLADRTQTRRAPFLFGLIALSGATVMICVGKNIALMVVGRLLQGVSAAVVWTVGLALLVDTVGTDGVGRSMGLVGIALSLGIMLAPLLGGIVYDKGGYYAVFAMAFGLLGLDIVLRLFMIERKAAEKWLPQTTTTTMTISEEAREKVTDVEGGRSGDGNSDDTGDLEIGEKSSPSSSPDGATLRSTSGTGELPTKISASPAPPTSSRHRLPPVLTLLASPRLLVALFAILVQAVLMTSLETTLPLHTRDHFDFSALSAGLIFLAIVIPTFIAPLIGHLSDLHGPKYYSALGYILACPIMVLMRIPTEKSARNIAIMVVLLAILGIAFTLQLTPMMAEITYVLVEMEKEKPGRFGRNGAYAQGYALFNVAFSGGTLVGPIWAGFVRSSAGWGTMTWSFGLLSGITALPILWYTGGKIDFKELRMRKRDANVATEEAEDGVEKG